MAIGCCTIIFMVAELVLMATGIVFIVQHKDNKDFQYHLWWWAIVGVVYIFAAFVWHIVEEILFCTGVLTPLEPVDENAPQHEKIAYTIRAHIFDYKNAMDGALLVVFLGLFCWGMYIFVHVLNMDHNPYAHALWVWFVVTYWVLSALFCLVIIILTCVVGCACCIGGTALSVVCCQEC